MPSKSSNTPGFKAVLIRDEPYLELKSLQSHQSCGHLPFRFDLKDITNAAMELALEMPGMKQRILDRAYQNVLKALPSNPAVVTTNQE